MANTLTLNDLNTTINHEPRILDTLIAERLGYERPRAIRQIIERNVTELESFGVIATRRGAYRNQPFTEYYLNEGQALVICALSRTPAAAQLRKAIIEVFMAWRAGTLEPAPMITPPQEPPTYNTAINAARAFARLDHLMPHGRCLRVSNRMRSDLEALKAGLAPLAGFRKVRTAQDFALPSPIMAEEREQAMAHISAAGRAITSLPTPFDRDVSKAFDCLVMAATHIDNSYDNDKRREFIHRISNTEIDR